MEPFASTDTIKPAGRARRPQREESMSRDTRRWPQLAGEYLKLALKPELERPRQLCCHLKFRLSRHTGLFQFAVKRKSSNSHSPYFNKNVLEKSKCGETVGETSIQVEQKAEVRLKVARSCPVCYSFETLAFIMREILHNANEITLFRFFVLLQLNLQNFRGSALFDDMSHANLGGLDTLCLFPTLIDASFKVCALFLEALDDLLPKVANVREHFEQVSEWICIMTLHSVSRASHSIWCCENVESRCYHAHVSYAFRIVHLCSLGYLRILLGSISWRTIASFSMHLCAGTPLCNALQNSPARPSSWSL